MWQPIIVLLSNTLISKDFGNVSFRWPSNVPELQHENLFFSKVLWLWLSSSMTSCLTSCSALIYVHPECCWSLRPLPSTLLSVFRSGVGKLSWLQCVIVSALCTVGATGKACWPGTGNPVPCPSNPLSAFWSSASSPTTNSCVFLSSTESWKRE